MKNQTTTSQPDILQKISYFLSGFFLTLFTFAILLKIINNLWGVIIALLINFAASGFMLKKFPATSPRRLIGIGAITSVIMLVVVFAVLWGTIQVMFQGAIQ